MTMSVGKDMTMLNTIDAARDKDNDGGEKPGPKAVLVCHQSSHPFKDRTISLDNRVKVRIGRSVGNAKAAPNNAIFDCKVLSRNHASIWYDNEGGKFFIKDTRSSNGTFVNSERLSKSTEESERKEIYSGDTVQFGVDVVENSRNVMHGCIIATLKLFLPDGTEAKSDEVGQGEAATLLQNNHATNSVSLKDMYKLNEYLKEALYRESILQEKLNRMDKVSKCLRESTKCSWKALISNNTLMARVELLELQLECYSNKFQDDELRKELCALQENKKLYEGAVRKFFKKISAEKIALDQSLQDAKRALEDAAKEKTSMAESLACCQKELIQLLVKYVNLEKSAEELKEKMAVLKGTEENVSLKARIAEQAEVESSLRRSIKELESHGDYSQKQVVSLQQQVEELQKHHGDILCELINPNLIKDKTKDAELIRSWICVYNNARTNCESNAAAIRARLEELKMAVDVKQCRVEERESEFQQASKSLKEFVERDDLLVDMNLLVGAEKYDDLPPVLSRKDYKDWLSARGRLERINNLLQAEKDGLLDLTVLYVIEEDKLAVCEKQMANLEEAVSTLKNHLESVSSSRLEPEPVSRDKAVADMVAFFHAFAVCVDEKLQCFNEKLSLLQESLRDFGEYAEAGEFLQVVKGNAVSLCHSVEEAWMLLNLVEANALMEGKRGVEEKEGSEVASRGNETECGLRIFNEDRDVVAMEKLKLAVRERDELAKLLAAAREDSSRGQSVYPHFGYYALLPVSILVLACFLTFGGPLSLIFGTSG